MSIWCANPNCGDIVLVAVRRWQLFGWAWVRASMCGCYFSVVLVVTAMLELAHRCHFEVRDMCSEIIPKLGRAKRGVEKRTQQHYAWQATSHYGFSVTSRVTTPDMTDVHHSNIALTQEA